MEKMFTVKEVGEMLNLSYGTILKGVKKGIFAHHRFSERKIFFTENDINEIIEKSQIKPTEKSVC